MTRLGRQIRSTVSKNNILQSLSYRGGFAPPTSRCPDLYNILRSFEAPRSELLSLGVVRLSARLSNK